MDQCDNIVIPEINLHTYDQFIFNKGGKNIQWRKDSLFNMLCWEKWTAKCKVMRLKIFSHNIYKNKLKMSLKD